VLKSLPFSLPFLLSSGLWSAAATTVTVVCHPCCIVGSMVLYCHISLDVCCLGECVFTAPALASGHGVVQKIADHAIGT